MFVEVTEKKFLNFFELRGVNYVRMSGKTPDPAEATNFVKKLLLKK